MKLNISKCKIINFSNISKILFSQFLQFNINLTLNDVLSNLNVLFHNKIRFNIHINSILGYIKRQCREFINPSAILCLYNALVRSNLKYASVIWSPPTTFNNDISEDVKRKLRKT